MLFIIADHFVINGKPADLVEACHVPGSIIRFGLPDQYKLAKANVTVYPKGKPAFLVRASCTAKGAEICLDNISKKIRCTTGSFAVDYVTVSRTGKEYRCRRRFNYMA